MTSPTPRRIALPIMVALGVVAWAAALLSNEPRGRAVTDQNGCDVYEPSAAEHLLTWSAFIFGAAALVAGVIAIRSTLVGAGRRRALVLGLCMVVLVLTVVAAYPIVQPWHFYTQPNDPVCHL
ncbi:MAG TPA: hypothetical protein VM677_04440 [Actinokineospora sp.]|nr:hypothetical protein [Actinokineospora sp.]